MAFKIVILVIILEFSICALLQKSSTVINVQPPVCHLYPCPEFTHNSTVENEYQIRDYKESVWISTGVASTKMEDAQVFMFKKLFKYIRGYNWMRLQIPMAAPVLFRSFEDPNFPNPLLNYTMSFFIPRTIKIAPLPIGTNLYVKKVPKFRAYVRAFPGYIKTLAEWKVEAKQLSTDLKLNDTKYDNSYFFAATYNGPYERNNRHNEIWFIERKSVHSKPTNNKNQTN